MTFGLSTEDIDRIRATFAKFPAVTRVILYGSRAMGREKVGSDIDLVIAKSNFDLAGLNDLRTQLDDLLLPYTFDIAILEHIENPALIEHIERVGRPFYP